MIHCANKCRKWSMGQVDFSPGVIKWKYKRDAWGLIFKYHNGNKINTAMIRRQAKKCGIRNPLSGTLQEAKKAYNLCRDRFNKLKPLAESRRRAFL